MGKRELLIIVIFSAIGVVVWQLTAPPAKEGQGFSFSRFLGQARREIQRDIAAGTYTHTGTIPVGAAVTDLRVAGVPRGVQIIGEDRRDVAYELVVESSGPDAATAVEYAKRVVLKPDDMGPTLALSVSYPREARQWAALTLKVPARLSVRLEAGTGARVTNLAALDLDRVAGITTAEAIAGSVTGTLANSELTIAGAGQVNLTLATSRARLSRIARGATLNLRSGRCEISESQGAVEIDEQSADVSIINHAGPIRADGTGGRITIDNPRQSVTINVRRAPIAVTLRERIAVTVVGADERVRLVLDGPPAVTLDALAVDGRIDATAFGLSPESVDRDQRLTKIFGGANAPRVTIRNSRGDIVIAKSK
jgi:hypothetical protein